MVVVVAYSAWMHEELVVMSALLEGIVGWDRPRAQCVERQQCREGVATAAEASMETRGHPSTPALWTVVGLEERQRPACDGTATWEARCRAAVERGAQS